MMEDLLERRDWLDERHRRPVPGKPYSQYLLHLSKDEAWSVVSFVWPRGSTTPIHDHCTWGVIGVYEGEETETKYTAIGSSQSGRLRVEARETATMHAGGVSSVNPPDDIHRVSNNGRDVAVSIHVYGTNIGKQRRHIIDADTGTLKDFISGYDNAYPRQRG